MTKAKKLSHLSKLLPIFLFIILFILIIITYQIITADKYYPFTFVGNTNISLLTEGQAIRKIESNFQKRTQQKLTFAYPQGSFTIDIATSSAKLDYSLLDQTFKSSHNNQIWDLLKLQFQTLFSRITISPKISLSLDSQLDNIALAIDKAPQNAQLIFNEIPSLQGTPSASIQIKPGTNGFTLDKETLEKTIANYLLIEKYNPELPLKTTFPKITTDHLIQAKKVLEDSQTQPIKLVFNQHNWTIDTKQLLTLLNVTAGDSLLDKDQTYSFLKNVSTEIDQKVQEGLFEFNKESKRVTAFKPSADGQELDIDKTYILLSDTLTNPVSNAQKIINLPVNIIKPKIETSDVNSLGIKELIGRGISNFAGSIPNRIFNVNLTASKINGVLIPAGEIFSFNKTVGDITAATGFKQAYVIKEGRTVLDDGGGVCQDSTTLFRAVLDAGLPVVQRTTHAYRVGYYEQGFPPGLDATIFYPSVDFQFKNDTPSNILIQAYTVGLTLFVDLYGTDDGRIATLTKSVVTNQIPPPQALRQDDPTLPKGTVKQVDFAAWGAKVTFGRTVTRGKETLTSENWVSNYKPWQAIFLVGTKEN